MSEPVEWVETFNAVHVRIVQGMFGRLELKAVGTRLEVTGRQYTDRGNSVATGRTRTLALAGLKTVWERGVLAMNTGLHGGVLLTLMRDGRPDIHLPDLRLSDEDVNAVCEALERAGEAATRLQGMGQYEVPRALRGLLSELEED